MTTTDPATLEPVATDDAPAEQTREQRMELAHQRLLDGGEFDVKVSGHWKVVKPHPLAMEFPVMDYGPFVDLIDDVERHGFREPVHLVPATGFGAGEHYTQDVLEGRHRVAVAWVLGISLNGSHEFTGDAEEAHSLVLSLNLHRRHLNVVQRAALVRRHVLPALKVEAEERMRSGKEIVPGASSPKGRASAIAAEQSGGLVSDRTIDRLAPLDAAPHTYQDVMLGELTTVPAIRKAAEEETWEAMTPAQKAAVTRAKKKEAAASGSKGTRTKKPPTVDAILTRWEDDMDALERAWSAALFGTSFEDCADRLIALRGRMAMVEENGNGDGA